MILRETKQSYYFIIYSFIYEGMLSHTRERERESIACERDYESIEKNSLLGYTTVMRCWCCIFPATSQGSKRWLAKVVGGVGNIDLVDREDDVGTTTGRKSRSRGIRDKTDLDGADWIKAVVVRAPEKREKVGRRHFLVFWRGRRSTYHSLKV